MAEADISMNMEHVCCAICLDMLHDPVTIPCGHSYCVNCITHFWDQDDRRRSCCPQCRRSFDVRPELNRNTILAGLVEKLWKSGNCPPKSPPPSDSVGCDACRGNILPAVKSCLVCLASYCELHVQPHFESPAFKKHKLVAPCKRLQEKICSVHDRLYEFYCRTDQACVCYLCTMGEHEGHDILTAENARAEKGEELRSLGRTLNQGIQQREKCSAQEASGEVERTSTELLASIKRRHSEVMEFLKAQEKTELRGAEGLLERVEMEIADLRKTAADLEKTLETNDHIDFLQSYLFLNHPSVPQAFDVPIPNHKATFKKVIKFVSKLQKILENICGTHMSNILETETNIPETPLSVIPEPKTRKDFLHYSCYLTLDSAPGHPNLCVCEGGRAVEWVAGASSGSVWPQMNCREGLTGRCYWEAQWSGSGICTVGLTEGRESRGLAVKSGFGRDTLSWGLDCFQLSCVFRHGNDNVTVVTPRAANTVGVYLDHRAGILSFYSVSDKMTLLHRAHACFTQPLYPGFGFWANAWQIGTDSVLFGRSALTSEKGHMSVKLLNL
ncbi:tripartite motif-containing protein 16-like isoform X2 [Electrophorus electricus]|uniref:tripartite motif-containing protein 16-like isoform X2 n=1 Tax=Electrophorus electricus TaxID=8005 RepID=UPI0015D02EF5|nr:tripartite motif-containing protein 16-like isoform X2 [Electrophorus electricus]